MYEEFYGFREKPFSILPDPSFLFLSRKHRRALTMLEYGVVSGAGFSVITGAIGSGKTTLIRKLLQRLDRGVSVGLVSNTQCESFEELLRWVLFSFELDYRGKDKVELYHAFTDFLISEFAARHRVVLIIDEAQHLGPHALEQLRMLSNVNADKHQLLQLVLVGQPELRHLLLDRTLIQFAQRIAVAYHLEPLSEEETRSYIQHRLRVGGGPDQIFAPDTFGVIWKATGGVPRLINLLCDSALVYGYAEQRRRIDIDLVNDVIKDKQDDVTLLGRLEGESGAGQVPLLTDIISPPK